MKPIIFSTLFFCFHFVHAQDSFQLARPLAKFHSVFFSDSAKLELKFAQQGAKIYYTIDNGMFGDPIEPSMKSLLYKHPLILKKRFTTIKAKVFQTGYRPSETIELFFAKQGKQIKKITSTAPNPKYPGSGDSSLFDNKGGTTDLSSKTWMGFDADTVHLYIELKKTETIQAVLLSFLQNEDSWIFLPELILVYYFDENKKAYYPFGKEVLFSDERSPTNVNFRFILSKTVRIKTNKLMIDLRTVKKMPDWHPARGQHAWCFIDEIKVY